MMRTPPTRSFRVRRSLRLLAVAALVSVGMGSLPGVATTMAPGSQLWVRRYDGPANSYDRATALASSPDGSAVFVTGTSVDATLGTDYVTVAYESLTGARLWAAIYDGPGGSRPDLDEPAAIRASPDGTRVFVTGTSRGRGSGQDFATVAYNLATGAELWVTRYDGPQHGRDDAVAIGVSPDGSSVFVTGRSRGTGSGTDYATAAYDAATGARLWVSRYDGPPHRRDVAAALGVSPDGSSVFVTGRSLGTGSGLDYSTVAYDAAAGTQRWVTRYDGPEHRRDIVSALGVSPDGSAVFVTGQSFSSARRADYATVAYRASTGVELWARRFDGPASRHDAATALGVSPDGSLVFVTGESATTTSTYGPADYATVGYATATGVHVWEAGYNGPANRHDGASALGVNPDGSEVYVTGISVGSTGYVDYLTVAYDVATEAQLWVRRYDGSAHTTDVPTALDVRADGTQVFVTGWSIGATSTQDYATVAYDVS